MKKVLLSLLLAIACMPMAIGQNKAGNLFTTDTTVCSSFTWSVNGMEYTHDTVAIHRQGDSTFVLNLTVSSYNYDTLGVRELTGSCFVSWNNKQWRTAGEFRDTIHMTGQCDSIVDISIVLNDPDTAWTTATACDYYVFHGDTLRTTGRYDYLDTATTSADCQVQGLDLTIAQSYTDTADVVVRDIEGGCRVTWLGNTYTFGDTNTTFYGKVPTVVGNCDSLVAIRITGFNGTQYDTVHVDNCGKYTWAENNATYESDTLVTVSRTTASCAENTTLDLHIVANYDTVNASACDRYMYRFDARAGVAGAKDTAYFYETGLYTTDQNGELLYSTGFISRCVTYHVLNVVVSPIQIQSNPDPVYDTVCDTYTISFNGRRYTFTQSVDSLLVSQMHIDNEICYDTTRWIHIVVNHRSYSDTTVTTCDSYYWPFTGQTYTASTVQTYVLPDTVNSVKCDSIGRLNLTVNYTPQVTIEGNWHLHVGESNVATLKIVDNAADRNTYKWYKNNAATPFSTADSVAVTVDANTDIHLETTSNKGCVANNWITITYTVGIDDVDGINVNLYPNPTSRYLNVESAEGISEVVVYNVIGQKVIRQDVNASATQLDLGTLAAGNYTLQIRSANGEQTTRKFIVNK